MRALALATLVTACTAATDDAAPPAPAENVLAAFEHPTADGLAHYMFRFIEDDGAIATIIGTPPGYPAPVDDRCALDTFLKVAPDDAIVPIELRRACGDVADATARRVSELRAPGLTFTVKPLTAAFGTGPFCTPMAYYSRYKKMREAAETMPPVYEWQDVCDVEATRSGTSTCKKHDAVSYQELGRCDYAAVTAQCGDENPCCIESHGELVWLFDGCPHEVTRWNESGTWNDWQGDSGFGASHFQAEVSACVELSTTIITWKKQDSINAPWGPVHETLLSGMYWWVLKIESGRTADGKHRGARYVVHANGNGFRPVFVAAIMQGMDHDVCSIPFPL